MLAALSEMLQQVNPLSTFLRLLLAVLAGGIIGLERGSKGRPAGMRTYMLVCVGSTLAMVTGQYITEVYGLSDPARIGAQVVSGIGFLGAGTIIITRDRHVTGLTTAAGLWASACMGLAIGIGFYTGAILGAAFIILITTIMHSLDTRLLSQSMVLSVYVELAEHVKLGSLLRLLKQYNIRATAIEFSRQKYDVMDGIAVLVSMHLPKKQPHEEIVGLLQDADFIDYAEEI